MVAMLSGIDISKWQTPASLNWEKIAATQSFAFARATYGTTLDPSFDEHFAGAREAGLRTGGYHFFRPGQSVVDQINAFCRQLDGMRPDGVTLPPALDVESNQQYDGDMTPERYATPVRAAVELLLARYGSMLLYVTQRDWRLIGNPDCITMPGVLLWVAHYTPNPKPATPMGLPWTFWQYSGDARIDGCGNQSIDANRFMGDVANLPTIGGAFDPQYAQTGEVLDAIDAARKQ